MEFKNNDITDPDLIGPFDLELLPQEIFALSFLPFFASFLCRSADTADSQLLHKLRNIFFAGFAP